MRTSSAVLLLLNGLNLIPHLEKFVNFFDEDSLRPGHPTFNLHDLLADQLINGLHVFKHLVNLVIEALQVLFVVSQLGLFAVNLRLAVTALQHWGILELHIFLLQDLVDLANGSVLRIGGLNLGIL